MKRRQKTAEETRQNIITAGRKLFTDRGYAQSRVEDIAALAGVAPVTVYASTGGKVGILQALIESCGRFQVQIGFDKRVAKEADADVILIDCAHTMRLVREEFEDVIYAMHDAAPSDKVVADMLMQATERYRGVCTLVAARLMQINRLRGNLSVSNAADLLWFYFGWWSWYTLHNENGWGYNEAEDWLLASVRVSLLDDVHS